MARQPFHPQYTGYPTSVGSDSIERLPKLAELVGRCVVNWSNVELQLSLCLGSMLGIENYASVAVFLSLRNHRAQREALNAAAKQTLASELLEVFQVIMNLHKQLDSQRNDVAHCIWGESSKIKDAALWSSMQDHANMLMVDYHLESIGKLGTIDRATHITKDYFVVTYADLEHLNDEIRSLARIVRNFHAHLRYAGQIQGAAALRQLSVEPLFQRELEETRKREERNV